MTNNARGRKGQPTASSFRRTAMASAVALAITPMILQSAYAQQATYLYTPPTTALLTNSGYLDKYVPNDQSNLAAMMGALISNVTVTATYVTAVGGTSVLVSGNSTTASSIGNTVKPNSIDLLLMQPTGSAGILSSQIRTGVGGLTSTNSAAQTAVTMGVDTANQAAATITVTGNSIATETLLNQQRSTITGSVPANYVSTTDGAVSGTYNGTTLATSTQGSLGINSNQVSLNAGGRNGSISTIDTSKITLDLDASTTALSAPLILSTNSISAAYTGNESTNTLAATGGSSFTGSMALTNAQANIETAGAGGVATALVTTSQINADVTSRAGPDRALTAALVVNDNSVGTTSTGNAAGVRTSSGIVAGNSITIANGMSFTGAVTGATNTSSNPGATQTSSATGDMVLLNGQGNLGTYFTSQTQGDGATPLQNGVITTRADTIGAGGSITSNGNAVTAGATGNLAGNIITATNSLFTGTVAAANNQVNDTTSVTGTVNFGSVTVNVGDTTSGAVTRPITMDSNVVAASAEGSVAATSISITSANLTTATGGAASATAGITAGGSVASTSGTSVSNLQGNYGVGAVSSTVYSSFVAANMQGTAAVPLVGLTSATVTLDGNAIDSSATGNAAGSVVALGGSVGTAQATVANAQINTNTVNGQVLDSGIRITSGAVSASTVTLANNAVSSSGVANDAFNSVGSTVGTLTLPGNPLTATPSASVTAAGLATSNAAFGIASTQSNTASVSSLTQNLLSAGTGGGFATVYAGTAASPNVSGLSTITVSGNDVTSTTRGNVVNNGVSFGGSNVDTAANAAMAIASIASGQSNVVTGVANATIDSSSPAVTGVGITYVGALTGSTLNVTDNDVAASTVGNDATNRIATAGSTLTSAAAGVTTGSINPATGAVNNELSIANVQNDAVSGGRTALVQRVTTGISQAVGATTVSDSDLTVDGNQMLADARNNNATNTLNLTGFSTLSTGVGVLNSQTSSTNVAANVTEGRIRIRVAGVAPTVSGGSNLLLSDNIVQGQATGSVAANTVTASSGTLSGNATLVTSGVTAGAVSADYGIANSQTQSGTASSFLSTPIRIVAPGTVFTGSSVIASGNTASALAQGTSAANTLTLAATGASSALTGAIGSTQTTSGAVTATVRPEPVTTTAVISVDGLSFTNTPVTVTGNRVEAGAGQNSATNTQTVTGGGITGRNLADSVDFVTDNAQTGTGAVTALALPGHTGLLADLVDTSVITVSGNVQLAAAGVNAASNSLGIASTAGVNANGSTNNVQNANSGAVSATVGAPFVAGVTDVASIGLAAATVGASAPDLAAATVTVNANSVRAQASRNSATNSTTVSGANVTGGTTGVGGLTQSFTTVNTQTGTGDVTGTAAVGVIGTPVSLAQSVTVINVNANSVSAAANVNQATNTQALSAVSTLTGSGIVSSTQASPGGTLSATTNVVAVGTIPDGLNGAGSSLFTSGLVPGSVTVAGNVVESQAGRNTATNALTAQGATVTGNAAMLPASFESRNTQTAVGDITSATTVGTIGSFANSSTNNSFTVAGNRASSLSNANTSTNTLGLAAASALSGTGRVNNTQTADSGAIGATVTTTNVGLRGVALDNTPVTVAGNIMNAEASRNVTTNILAAAGSTVAGTPAGAPASFTILSNQSGNGNVTTTNSLGLVGATQNSAFGGTTFGVVDNLALAASNVNIATNRMVLNAVSSLTGTGQVSNTQNSGMTGATAVTATVGGTIGTPATIGVTPFTAGNTQNDLAATVTGNTLAAQGGGNTAANSLEAAANSSIGGSVVFPTYGVLNLQNNAATVTTTVSYANIGNTVGGTATATTTTVTGNQAAATSYGNSASNSLLMSALAGGLNTASAMVSNTQLNTASMTATVTGVSIGMNGGGTTGGSTTIVNNAITARAVGNSGSNVIGIK
ncbi:S-layer family protein [Caenimonas sp. SL110]|uniref:beta strand repeat-containing protein n=1 Tax=Caenimonas sp. SL110 TaxID=1450524 RepID=UPI000652DF52|nr:S-layer family protein [Caenimonas sp. SL110]